MVALLVVCLGNICRSPAARVILSDYAKAVGLDLTVDSCGLGDWHKGSSPDPRMIEAAKRRGYELTGLARSIRQDDFTRFDTVLAADRSVVEDLKSRFPAYQAKIHHLGDFSAKYKGLDIYDPYHGDLAGFETTLDQLEAACHGVIQFIISRN